MKICYNTSAMIANNALTKNDDRLTRTLERLSSGLKITGAKDNPAGMAIGKKMNAQIKGIAKASQNSSDAVSVIEIADGAMSEIHEILQRMNELCVQASTGTNADEERKTIEEEISQLKSEITRISNTTQFNGQTLMNGSFELRGYTSDPVNAKVGYLSDGVTIGEYEITKLEVSFDADGNIISNDFEGKTTGTPAFPNDAEITSVQGNTVKITSPGNKDFEMNIKVKRPDPLPGTVTLNNLKVEVTGIGSMTMQIGANEGQTMDIRIPKIALDEMGIDNLKVTDADSALAGIDSVKNAVQYVSEARSRLGAYQNRLEHSISSLDITSENLTAAYSRIMDANMAEEMTEYTTVQVISQASMSMLAQANERPAQVLQLLQ